MRQTLAYDADVSYSGVISKVRVLEVMMSKELRRMLLASAAVQTLGLFTESGVITGIGIALLVIAARVWWVKDSVNA